MSDGVERGEGVLHLRPTQVGGRGGRELVRIIDFDISFNPRKSRVVNELFHNLLISVLLG